MAGTNSFYSYSRPAPSRLPATVPAGLSPPLCDFAGNYIVPESSIARTSLVVSRIPNTFKFYLPATFILAQRIRLNVSTAPLFCRCYSYVNDHLSVILLVSSTNILAQAKADSNYRNVKSTIRMYFTGGDMPLDGKRHPRNREI